jgi:hypothetical protein
MSEKQIGPYPDVFGGKGEFDRGAVNYLADAFGPRRVLLELADRHSRLRFEIWSWGQFAADAAAEMEQGMTIDGAIELCQELAGVAGEILGCEFKPEIPCNREEQITADKRRVLVHVQGIVPGVGYAFGEAQTSAEIAATMREEYHNPRYTADYVDILILALYREAKVHRRVGDPPYRWYRRL